MDSEDIFVNANEFLLEPKKAEIGEFFIVNEKATNHKYLAKELEIDSYLTSKSQKMLINEITNLKKLQHTAIIQFKGFSYISFKEDKKWNPTIITEFISDTTLANKLNENRGGKESNDFTQTNRYVNLLGISSALNYLHQNKIFHGNLNPENVFLDEKFHPKICDFGISRNFKEIIKKSYVYIAPEILQGEPYGFSSDIYSFAMVAYELITGIKPYSEINEFSVNVLNQIISGNVRPNIPSNINKKMKDLIENCWNSDPIKRPLFEKIYSELSNNIKEYQNDIEESEINEYIESLSEKNLENTSELNIELNSNDNLRKVLSFYLSDERTGDKFKNILFRAFLKGNLEIAKLLLSMKIIDVNSKYISYLFLNEILYVLIYVI